MSHNQLLRRFLLTFFATNLLLCYFCGLLFLPLMPTPVTTLSTVFSVFLYVGHIAIYALVLIVLLPLVVIKLLPERFIRSKTLLCCLFAAVGASIASIFLIADAQVYGQFYWHVNGFIWHMLLSGDIGDVADLSLTEWLGIGILIGVCVIVEFLLAAVVWSLWVVRRQPRKARLSFALLSLGIIAWIVAMIMHVWAAATYYQPILNAANLLPYSWKPNANALWVKVGLLDPAHKTKQHAHIPFMLSGGKLTYPLHPLKITPPAKKLNVLFLFIDTLRYDMITQATAPNMTAFSQKSTVFTEHYSGGDCTQPGVFSLFYSLPPNYWNAALKERRGALLINTLQRQGYRLGIYNSAPLSAPNFVDTLFPRVKNLQVETKGDEPWQRDEMINRQLIDFIKVDDSRPFFGYVFYDAVHAYSMPDHFPRKFKPWLRHINRITMLNNKFDPTSYKNRYKDTVVFVDHLMGDIFKVLKQRDLLKNTVVVITSDHGEQFNEYHNNYWGHGSGYSKYQIRTPFILYWPGKKPTQVNHMTTHYDLVPTLMKDVLGVQNPISDYSIGHSLFDATPRPFLISGSYGHTALITGDHVINFFPKSGFQITDRNMDPTPHAQIDKHVTQAALKSLCRFYSHCG